MKPILAVRYQVSGRVQGVGFRFFVRQRARELGLTGWVRNRSDGTVEAHAQGSEASLSLLHAAMEVGPAHARVEAATSRQSTFDEQLTSFTIR